MIVTSKSKKEVRTYALHFFMVLLLCTQLDAQEAPVVFDYLDKQVKTVHLSRTERLDYVYEEGLIRELQDLSLGTLVERHYYYTRSPKLDSVLYFEIQGDSIFLIQKDTYRYVDDQLVIIQYGEDPTQELVRIDSLTYRMDGFLDRVFTFANKQETIQGSRQTDSMRLQTITRYRYDEEGNLVGKSDGDFFDAEQTRYRYNRHAELYQEIQFLGHTRSGCIGGEDQKYCYITYRRNNRGLLQMRRHRFVQIGPDGSTRKGMRIRFRWKYDYY